MRSIEKRIGRLEERAASLEGDVCAIFIWVDLDGSVTCEGQAYTSVEAAEAACPGGNPYIIINVVDNSVPGSRERHAEMMRRGAVRN